MSDVEKKVEQLEEHLRNLMVNFIGYVSENCFNSNMTVEECYQELETRTGIVAPDGMIEDIYNVLKEQVDVE